MPNGHSVSWAAKEGASPTGHSHHDTDAKEVIRSIYEIDDLNLPGSCGGSVPWEGWSYAKTWEIPGRAA